LLGTKEEEALCKDSIGNCGSSVRGSVSLVRSIPLDLKISVLKKEGKEVDLKKRSKI
jgi:hypothetical protein